MTAGYGATYAPNRYSRQLRKRRRFRHLAFICLLVASLACIAYVSFGSLEFVANAMDGASFASSAPKSTPRSQWRAGSVPVLYQIDSEWASSPYAEDTLGESGCGPTCLAMVYVGLTGKTDKDPAKMCRYSEREGFVVDGMTSWDLMTTGAEDLGLESEVLPADADAILSRLREGHPVIASVGPGTFTTTGHFIVLSAVDSDGRVIVHDPNSFERTNRTWDLGEILTQFRNIWSFSR